MSARVYPEPPRLIPRLVEEPGVMATGYSTIRESTSSADSIYSDATKSTARYVRNEPAWIAVSLEGNTTGRRTAASTSDDLYDGEQERTGSIEEIILDEVQHTLPLHHDIINEKESHRLVYYFKWLHTNPSVRDIDLNYIHQLLNEGSDVTATDSESSFTVLHFIATCWHHSVAELMIEHGCHIDITDDRGRTPLHIAAYNDHTDMVAYLLSKGAQKDAKSIGGQTAVHFAVRASSLDTLQILIVEYNASYDKDCRDNEGRTPLQLGAELDRTEAVAFLLSLDGCPSGCDVHDNKGHSALTSMIINMPHMARMALNQLHKTIPSERRQEYLLSRVESSSYTTKTPFEATIEWNASDVLTHPVMKQLIEMKWKKLARWYFLIDFAVFALFLIVWSFLVAYPSIQEKHIYNLPEDTWRILLGCLGLVLLIFEIANEVREYAISFKKHKRYMEWLFPRLYCDLENCQGIGFEEERQFIRNKLTEKVRTRYFTNAWNYIDLLTYFLLMVVILLHCVDIVGHSQQLAQWNARIASLAVILIWVKLLAYLRASATLGPMVAILSHVTGKIAQYLIIFAIFFFPYVIDYWLLFGGPEQSLANVTSPSTELTSIHRLFVVLYRMSVIDDYPYEAIRDTDELSATVLTLSFLLINAIIALNLFIALLSDTFQRVYDNAFVNAEFQKASLILVLEDKGPERFRKRFVRYVRDHCSPATDYYDDDDEIEGAGGQVVALGKVTHQTNILVRELTELVTDQRNEISQLQNAVYQLKDQMSTLLIQPSAHSSMRQEGGGPLLLPPVQSLGLELASLAPEHHSSRWLLRSAMASSRVKRKESTSFLKRKQESSSSSDLKVSVPVQKTVKKWIKLINPKSDEN